MKFLKVVITDKRLIGATFVEIILSVFGIWARWHTPGNTVEDNIQSGLIALYVTIFVYIISRLYDIISLYKRYCKLDGSYSGYGFVSDTPDDRDQPGWNQLDPKVVSRAKLTYKSGHDFILELNNQARGKVTHTWLGSFKMTSDNMADIGWQYTKWPDGANLQNSTGYKRAVVVEDGAVKIFMFSPDQQRFGREVLVKDIKTT